MRKPDAGPDRDGRTVPADHASADALLITALYVAFTGLLWAVLGWWLSAGAHALVVTVLLTLRRAPQSLATALLPLVLLTPLYVETGHLSEIIWAGRTFDAEMLALDDALFGRSPALWLSEVAPWYGLSELLHVCYASFWIVVPGIALELHRQGRARDRDACVLAVTATFLTCFLAFMTVPVNGPRGVFPPLDPHLHGPFLRLCHAVLEGGAATRAAFPSGHVAVMMVCAACTRRWLRPLYPLVAALGVGVAVCTVYGRFHYAVDALAGLFVAWRLTGTFERLIFTVGDPAAATTEPG